MDAYTPVRGKCTWWREATNEDDRWNMLVKVHDRRIICSCFVEGNLWEYRNSEMPTDCPDARRCRYHIRHW